MSAGTSDWELEHAFPTEIPGRSGYFAIQPGCLEVGRYIPKREGVSKHCLPIDSAGAHGMQLQASRSSIFFAQGPASAVLVLLVPGCVDSLSLHTSAVSPNL